MTGLRAAATLLVPLAVAGLVAVTSYPLVAWLERHRMPTRVAVIATLLVMVLTVLGPGMVVLNAATTVVSVAPDYAARLNAMSGAWFEWLDERGIDTSPLAGVVNWTAALNLAGGLVVNAAFVLSNAASIRKGRDERVTRSAVVLRLALPRPVWTAKNCRTSLSRRLCAG